MHSRAPTWPVGPTPFGAPEGPSAAAVEDRERGGKRQFWLEACPRERRTQTGRVQGKDTCKSQATGPPQLLPPKEHT